MKDFIKGAIFGAVVTGVAVALTTPKTGEELREDILDFSTDAYNKGLDKAHELKERSREVYLDQKENIEEQIETLKQNINN